MSNDDVELFFQNLKREQISLFLVNHYIDQTLSQALAEQNLDLLLSLIPYIETGAGKVAYENIGETRRILRILHIIDLERQHQKNIFCLKCTDKESLIEKYLLSLFAFRRLIFGLSTTSTEDAIQYLRQSQLSVIAVYVITQEDLIIPDASFYNQMIEIYSGCWTENDIQLLLTLISPNRGIDHERP